jgi:hypothetical protein
MATLPAIPSNFANVQPIPLPNSSVVFSPSLGPYEVAISDDLREYFRQRGVTSFMGADFYIGNRFGRIQLAMRPLDEIQHRSRTICLAQEQRAAYLKAFEWLRLESVYFPGTTVMSDAIIALLYRDPLAPFPLAELQEFAQRLNQAYEHAKKANSVIQ